VSKRVFLSYKRHSDPDEGLALQVHGALAEAGHSVFIDQDMPAGVKWADQISDQIRSCDALIVFLNAASLSQRRNWKSSAYSWAASRIW
jgi:TIR domain